MVTTLFLAFWNLENLFDVESAERPEKIRKMVAKDIAGWDKPLLDAKLRQLSKVIRSMNGGNGPDILGVCEVENRNVLIELANKILADGGRSYSVVHADTSDNRGVDVAFLFDPGIAKTSPDEMFQHWIVKRYATRELFQVNFIVNNKKMVFIGNHWPSRTSGQYESEPFRMIAGETLSYWVERIHEELGNNVGVVVMGDFNDEPFNRSITEYALSVNDSRVVMTGRNQYLLNMMWSILSNGRGSHLYNGRWNMLDQIMISRAIVNGKSGWKAKDGAQIEAREIMSSLKKPGPRKFGIKPADRDTDGFSDHFPVSLVLVQSL